MSNSSSRLLSLLKILALTLLALFTIHLINIHGIEAIRNYVEERIDWAPAGIFILRFTSIIIPALPSTAYSILSGALLGFKKGIIVIAISDLMACSFCFFVSKRYGRSFIENILGKEVLRKIERFSTKHLENNFFLMLGLLMTGLFDFVSYGIGLTKTTWKKFIPALVISICISDPPIVALGSGLFDGGKQILIFSLIGIFSLSILTSKLRRKNQKTYDL